MPTTYPMEDKSFLIIDWVDCIVLYNFCTEFPTHSVSRQTKHVNLHIWTTLPVTDELTRYYL